MKTNIKVDVDKIAAGIVEMHHEIDASGPLAFGMLDAHLMDVLSKQLTAKAVDLFPSSTAVI